jgi:hypothetical protein
MVMGSSLPLLGLEFKILSLAILLAALIWLLRRLESSPLAQRIAV